MGILTTAIGQLTNELLSFGFGQLDDFVTRKIQEGRDEEAFAAADAWEKQALQGIQGGSGILGGGGDFQMPALPPEIGQSPEASKYLFPRYQQIIKQDPDIVGMQRERFLDEKGIGARSTAFGKLAGQRDIGTEAIVPGVRGDIDFSAGQLQESHAQGSGLTTKAQESAKEPFRDIAMQREIRKKQTPSYKQLQGGGGGGDGSFNVPGEFLNRAEKEILRDKSGVYVTAPESKSMFTPDDYRKNPALLLVDRESKEKPALTDRGLRVMQIAEEIAAKSKNRQPLSIINEAKAREKKEFKEQSKSSALQGAQRPGIQINPNPTPAAPERAKEVQTGRDPATENKIRVLRQKGITPEQIKQALKEEGKNPADYGY